VGTGNFFVAKLGLAIGVHMSVIGIGKRYAALKFPDCCSWGSKKIFCENEKFWYDTWANTGAL